MTAVFQSKMLLLILCWQPGLFLDNLSELYDLKLTASDSNNFSELLFFFKGGNMVPSHRSNLTDLLII